MIKTKDCVEHVLSIDERARNDDKWLILQVLRRMGFSIYIPYNEMKDMPAFESITRCRRKLHENDRYLASIETQKKRRNEEEEMEYINTWWDTR